VKRGGRWQAICAHPAFSVLAAVSFAALLSGGSLLLPTDLIGRPLNTSASAPLGFTARATLASAGALAGIGIGLSMARRVALSLGAENSDRPRADLPRCRPIDIAEDVGEEGIAAIEFPDTGSAEAPIHAQPTVAIEEVEERPPESSLDDLGLMQLTARLAASLAERGKLRGAIERVGPPAEARRPVGLGGFEPSGPEEAARAMADFFSQNGDREQATTLVASEGRNGNA